MTDVANIVVAADTTPVNNLTKALGGLREESTRAQSATAQMAEAIKAAEAAYNAERSTINEAIKAARDYTAMLETQRASVRAMNAEVLLSANVHRSASAAMVTAGKEAENVGKAAGHAAGGVSGITRELLVLGREASIGNWTRFGGSLTLLAQYTGVLGSAFTVVGASILVGTGALIGYAAAAAAGEAESRKLAAALITTGNYAGETASNVDDMSKKIATSSGNSVGSVRKIFNELIAGGKLGHDALESAADAAANYSRITGESADKYIKEYDGMKDHLIRWAVKHEDVYHDLTLSQLDHINLLIKEGQETKAQAELMADIDAKSKERLGEMSTNYGWLETVFHNVAKAAKDMWDAMLDIGRTETPEHKAAAIADRLTEVEARLKGTDPASPQYKDRAAAVSDVRAELQSAVNEMKTSAQLAAEKSRQAATEHDAIQAKYGDGKPKHARIGPQDDYEARSSALDAQINGMDAQIASAIASELKARLSTLDDVRSKQEVEDQIFKAEKDARDATFSKQIALAEHDKDKIDLDRGLNETERNSLKAKDDELISNISVAKIASDMKAGYERQKVLQDRQEQESQDQLAYTVQQHQNTIDILTASKNIYTSSVQRAQVEQDILDQEYSIKREKLVEAILSMKTNPVVQARLQTELVTLDETNAIRKSQIDLATVYRNSVTKAINSFGTVVDSFKSGDLGGAVNNLANAFNDFAATLPNLSSLMVAKITGIISGAGAGFSVASSLGIKGTGSKLGNLAVGAAGMIGGTLLAGSGAALGAASAVAGGLYGAGAVGLGTATSMTSLLSSSAVLGPLGIIAALAAAGLISALLGGKPTNAGAGYDLVTGAFSGSKSTKETQGYVKTAGDAILQGEQTLRDAGVQLKTTITGLVIGTRDLSQIYTSDGKTLTAAVGDAADAANVGLIDVLKNATYVSDAEKSMVDSMIAAGKGFDAITTALQAYAAAQQMITDVNDQILKFTNPQAYDVTTLQRTQDARMKAAQAAYDAQYLTTEQFDTLSASLVKLNGLELDATVKKYSDAFAAAALTLAKATTDAAFALSQSRASLNAQLFNAMGNTAAGTAITRQQTLQGLDPSLRGLQSAVFAAQDLATAKANLQAAYNAQSQALTQTVTQLLQLVTTLKAFRAELSTTTLGGGTPQSITAALKAQFNNTAFNAKLGDTTAAGNIPQQGRDYLTALQNTASTLEEYQTAVAEVGNATDDVAKATQGTADLAQEQLDTMNAQLKGILDIGGDTTSIVQLLQEYLQAKSNLDGKLKNTGNQFSGIPDVMDGVDLSLRGTGTLRQAFMNYQATYGNLAIPDGMGGFSGSQEAIDAYTAPIDRNAAVERGGGGSLSPDVIAAIAALHAEVAGMREDQMAIGVAVATSTQKSATIAEQTQSYGVPVRAVDPALPISVVVS